MNPRVGFLIVAGWFFALGAACASAAVAILLSGKVAPVLPYLVPMFALTMALVGAILFLFGPRENS